MSVFGLQVGKFGWETAERVLHSGTGTLLSLSLQLNHSMLTAPIMF